MSTEISENFNTIRKEVKKKMIDLEISASGRRELISKIGQKLGRKVSQGEFSMALTGYRKTNASQTVLETAMSLMITEENHEADHA